MKINRTVFILSASCSAAVNVMGKRDPDRLPVDLEEVNKAALLRFCEYMKRWNPHIRNWKKGMLPTKAELEALIKHHPALKEEFSRILNEFYEKLEMDEKMRDPFRIKHITGRHPSR